MSREMKHSGIEWIGDIPKEWKVMKLRNIGSFSASGIDKKIAEGEELVHIVNYVDVYNNDAKELRAGNYMLVSAPHEKCREHQLRIGDMIFTPSSETIEDIGLSSVVMDDLPNTAYSYHVIRFRANDSINLKYKKYLTNNHICLNYFSSYAIGTIRKTISREVFKECRVLLPPLSEQQKIADYLDKVCGEIDGLVALQEAMIDELKAYKQSVITEAVTRGLNPNVPLKPSGIDWIGDIPEHWEIGKLKHICKVNGRIGFRGYTSEDLVSEEEGAYAIGGKHISRNVLDLTSPDFLSWEKYYESPEIMVKKGDLVLAQRGTLGRVALIRDMIGPATINPSLVLLNSIKCNAVYLYWWLCSRPISIKIDLLNTSTAVPMISQKQIENMELILPSIEEQQQIANYLDTKCTEIDSLVTIKQQKIEELKEYKKSIIYEYVTGKKEVV